MIDLVRDDQHEYRGLLGDLLTIEVVQNDITREQVDAITNAANGDLAHGGGVAGAIANVGGPEITKESREYVKKHGRVPTGQVGVTGPGRLQCRYVIHAVGPIWNHSKPANYNINLLASAVLNTLKKANELECKTVSIPAISSGIFGFPKPLCARVFFACLSHFVKESKASPTELTLKTVRLCNFDDETCHLFRAEFDSQVAN